MDWLIYSLLRWSRLGITWDTLVLLSQPIECGGITVVVRHSCCLSRMVDCDIIWNNGVTCNCRGKGKFTGCAWNRSATSTTRFAITCSSGRLVGLACWAVRGDGDCLWLVSPGWDVDRTLWGSNVGGMVVGLTRSPGVAWPLLLWAHNSCL